MTMEPSDKTPTAKKPKRPLHPNHHYAPPKKKGESRHIPDDEKEVAWDELVRLRIRGMTQEECAKALGYARATITRWEEQPAYKLKMSRTRELIFNKVEPKVEALAEHVADVVAERIEEVMERYSHEGIHKIRQTMHDSDNEAVALKAAIDLADRGTRTGKTKKLQGTVGVSFLTPELLLKAAKAAREALENEALGRVIDAVPLDETMNPDIPLETKENDDDESDWEIPG